MLAINGRLPGLAFGLEQAEEQIDLLRYRHRIVACATGVLIGIVDQHNIFLASKEVEGNFGVNNGGPEGTVVRIIE